ncbi:hypothetical protein ACOMHN_024414 [Nucella lapillus]
MYTIESMLLCPVWATDGSGEKQVDPDEIGYGNKHQRISSSPADVETFEANGLLTSSPMVGEGGPAGGEGEQVGDSDSGLVQLRHVCGRLGVGGHGYLSQWELGQVCRYIGMDQMDEEELGILFKKLDADHDGYISFGEFVEGLARHAITPRGLDNPIRSPAPRPPSGRKVRTSLTPGHHDRRSPAVYASGESINLFSSLQPSDDSGMVTVEEVVDFWEQLNVPYGADLLMSLGFEPQSKSLGFEPQSKVPLRELSAALNAEWASQASEGSTLAHAITSTFTQELVCLRSWLEQTRAESRKLRADLTDALARNSLMAAEGDEHHAQLEKSQEERLKALEQEHQEQLRRLQSRLEQEQEAQSSQSAVLRQTSEQVQDLHQQVASLQDKLGLAETEVSTSQRRLSLAQEKEGQWEALYRQLQKEVQQQLQQAQPESPHSLTWEMEKQAAEEKAQLLAVQNKELKDHNDELLAQVEDLQQQVTSEHQQQVPSAHQQENRGGSQPRSSSVSRIPVLTATSSVSSDTSEWDDDDLQSSTEAAFFRQHGLPATAAAAATAEPSDKAAPSLSAELKQQQRQRRGERRERERKEIEHSFRVEIAELEDLHDEEKQHLRQNMEKEKTRLRDDYQSQLRQALAEQQKELQTDFALEKQDLLQQYESRINLTHLHHTQEVQALQDRLSGAPAQSDPIQDIAANLHTRSQVQELEKAKAHLEKELHDLRVHYKGELETQLHNLRAQHEADLEKEQHNLRVQHEAELETQLHNLRVHYEGELSCLREKYDDDVAQLKADVEERVQASLSKTFQEGVEGLGGKLKEHFLQAVQQHLHKDTSASDHADDKEELCAALQQDRLTLVQGYESQIQTLQQELQALRSDFEAERLAFQQLQSGELAQSIHHELQEEVGGRVAELRQSWEEERRELMVQTQLLEEAAADLKGQLTQERQRAAQTHALRDTTRRLHAENKEIQCLAEGLREKMNRLHQQQDLERANYERRIDELEHSKDQALRVQALKNAGTTAPEGEEVVGAAVLQQVIDEVQAARSDCPSSDSPVESVPQQEGLDQLQGKIDLLHHQLHEARSAQLQFQQLKDECELLRQTNINLEEMVRVLKQRSNQVQAEREKEDQEQKEELWEEKKKLQNLLQRTTDKLLKNSAEMAAGQTQVVREVEQLKQKAGNMVELETFTGLQVISACTGPLVWCGVVWCGVVREGEQLKQKAGNMVELETFTGLQVSLLETQRHAISLQEALMQRTQLADQMMAETEKEQRQERESWEERQTELLSGLEAASDRHRGLAAQHKALVSPELACGPAQSPAQSPGEWSWPVAQRKALVSPELACGTKQSPGEGSWPVAQHKALVSPELVCGPAQSPGESGMACGPAQSPGESGMACGPAQSPGESGRTWHVAQHKALRQSAAKLINDTFPFQRQSTAKLINDTFPFQRQSVAKLINDTFPFQRQLAAKLINDTFPFQRQSAAKLATQLKNLYVENADLLKVLQQTEAKQIAAQRQNRKLQRQCQAWHDAVHRMLRSKRDSQGGLVR